MVKESFSNKVTIETCINGNQPCIYARREGYRKVPSVESLKQKRACLIWGSERGSVWLEWFEWENGERRAESRQESDHVETYRPRCGVWIFLFQLQSLVNHAKDWHDNYVLEIHFRGQVENITRRWEGRKRGSCLGSEKPDGGMVAGAGVVEARNIWDTLSTYYGWMSVY